MSLLRLARKEGESLRIQVPPGDGVTIEVTVIREGTNRLHLSVVSPKCVVVHRKEVAERIAAGRRQP